MYYVDFGCGSNQCDAVYDIIREERVGNLYYTLCPEFLRVKIIADGHMLVKLFSTKYFYSLDSADEGMRSITVPLRNAATASSFLVVVMILNLRDVNT